MAGLTEGALVFVAWGSASCCAEATGAALTAGEGATFVTEGKAGAAATGAAVATAAEASGAWLAAGSEPLFVTKTITIARSTITPSTPEPRATSARREELFHSACVTEAP